MTRRVIHTAKKFRVERLTEPAADGSTRERDVVVHPGAAVLLPLLPDGRIVMINNYRTTLGRELLELPAGTLDEGEAPEACAARELQEETGYAAGRLRALLRFFATPGFCTEQMHTFVATELTGGAPRPEADEQIRVEIRTLPEALKAIESGEICDAKTIVSLLYYAWFEHGKGTQR